MSRFLLLGYQILFGLSDTVTGALLVAAPGLTLWLMRLHPPADALPFLSFIGAFVFSIGLSYLYGALLMYRGVCKGKLEIVWLLTAFTRASVAIFVAAQVAAGGLEAGWLTVAFADGACAVIQAAGLSRGWLANVAR